MQDFGPPMQGFNNIGSSLPRPRWGGEKRAKMDGGAKLRHPFLPILRNCVSSDKVKAVPAHTPVFLSLFICPGENKEFRPGYG
jgi:hypothetical protein